MRLPHLVVGLFVMVFGAFPASAQPWPALYNVTGVSADDVLNIRSEPDATSQAVGSFEPEQTGIEVIRADPSGKWGLVNQGEATGWVAMRYLVPLNMETDLPTVLQCYGTEPFWSLELIQDQTATLLFAGDELLQFDVGRAERAAGRTDRYMFDLAGQGHAIVRRASCNDGMSDREFGLDLDIILAKQGLWSGCCSLAPN